MKERKGMEIQKLILECITKDVVIDFLDWVQVNRHCSNATRNYRLAAIRSFFSYLIYENPERMYEWQKILSIKVKKHDKKPINYLTTGGIKLLLEQPDLSTKWSSQSCNACTDVRQRCQSTRDNRSYAILCQT